MKYIILIAFFVSLIASVVSFIGGDLLLGNIQLILALLFRNMFVEED